MTFDCLEKEKEKGIGFYSLEIYEKKLPISNNNRKPRPHPHVRDVKHHLVIFSIRVIHVQNVLSKFVNNVD